MLGMEASYKYDASKLSTVHQLTINKHDHSLNHFFHYSPEESYANAVIS